MVKFLNDDNRSGRSGEEEIDSILKELSQYDSAQSPLDTDELGEMASRYGVDLGDSGDSASYSSSSGLVYDTGYSAPQKREPVRPAILPDGQRIVYDAEAEAQMKYAADSKHTTGGVRVIYDADVSGQTATEAPFDDVSNVDPAIEEQIDKQIKMNKKAVKREKQEKKRPSNEDELTRFQRVLKVFLPWTGDPKKEIARKVIMDISFCVLFVCSLFLVDNFADMQAEVNKNKDIGNKIIDVDKSDEELVAEKWAQIKAKYPNVQFPEGMMIDLAELYAQNQDTVGYLSIENTSIDFVIVQKKDDTSNEYYLYRDFYKMDTKYGTPYMDYRNNIATLDQNTVIYGHHMRDGLKFADLEKYMTVDGYKDSPVIKFSTLYKTYYFKVYTAIVTAGSTSQDNGYIFNYIVTNFLSKPCFEGYIEALNERALYNTGVGLDVNDKIITLSTCSYEYDGARLVVVGRLLRDGESLDPDFSKIVINENPRYPQRWYDTKGISNPFRNAHNWNPADY